MAAREWQDFDLAKLVEQAEARGTPYLEFLRVPQLSCGIFQMEVGATDSQSTHDEDEVYFVIKGRATLMGVQGPKKLGPGSIVYVPADTEHGFVDIEEPLSMIVFFGSGGPSGANY